MAKHRAPVIGVMAALALAGCNMSAGDLLALLAGSRSATGLVADAKVIQERAKQSAAIAQLGNAVQKTPDDPALRFQLGQLHNEMFDGVTAEKELRKARELGLNEGGRVSAAMARALRLQGAYKRLVSEAGPSDDFDPVARAEIHVHRGYAFAALGNVAEANASLARAREAAGGRDLPMVDVLAANIRLSRRDVRGAQKILSAVLEAHPRFYDALALKADILRLTGDDAALLAAYRDVLEVNPRNQVALVARSTLLLKLGRLEDAGRDIQMLEAASKDHFITHFQQGLLRLRKGEFRLALESFQHTLKINPDFVQAALFAGMAQLALGDARAAERSLTQYVTARPEDRFGRKLLATTLVQLNESALALEAIAPVLDRVEGRHDFWEIAAEAYSKMGNYPMAAQWLSKAGAAKPAGEKQARLRVAGGHAELAIAELENVLEPAKGPAAEDTMRAVLHLSRREFDKAAAALDGAEKKAPGLPFVANLKGVVLLETGQREQAIKVFQDVLTKHPAFLPAATNLANLDLQDGKPDQARRRFEPVLAGDKTPLQALLVLAELERQLGRLIEAVALLERAANAYPNALEPRTRLVDLLMRQGKPQLARARAEEAVSRNPTSLAAYELLGGVQLRYGDKKNAVDTFTRLVSVHPKSAWAHFSKGRAEYAAGMSKEAEASLRQALTLDKSYRPARGALVELLLREKRIGPALELARTLQTEMPKSPDGLALEAEIQSAQKNYKEAIVAYRGALALAPADDIAARLYQSRVLAGDQKAALADLRRWLADHPASPVARAQLAAALLGSGDYEGAKKEYEVLAQGAPKDPLLMNNLAWAYFKARDPRALQFAEKALRLRPNNPSINDTLGWILLQQGDTARATELLGKAAKGLPNQPDVRYRYAAGLAKSGNRERARAELSSALSLGKPFEEREQAVALMEKLKR